MADALIDSVEPERPTTAAGAAAEEAGPPSPAGDAPPACYLIVHSVAKRHNGALNVEDT
jgi:hypothetical protein